MIHDFIKFQPRKKKIDYHHRFKKSALGRASRVYHLTEKRRWQKRILISLAILLFAGIFYFLFYSDYFKIQKINVAPAFRPDNVAPAFRPDIEDLVKQFLNQKKFYIFSQRNFFLFDKNQLEEIILAKYNLEELKILKKFPNELEIKIKEKLASLILSYQEDFWFLDGEGKILEKINEEKIKENFLPLVFVDFSLTDSARPEISVNQEIFSKERVHFIKEVSLGLLEIMSHPEFREGSRGSSDSEESSRMQQETSWFIIPAEKETKIIAKTQEGWEIYFDEMLSSEEQLNNLKLILKEKVKGETKNLKYIDLRFGERVYYR